MIVPLAKKSSRITPERHYIIDRIYFRAPGEDISPADRNEIVSCIKVDE
jgi:hypothetical protein